MAAITHVSALDYVAKVLGEDLELLEAIVSNDDNLSYGNVVSVYMGQEDRVGWSLGVKCWEWNCRRRKLSFSAFWTRPLEILR